MNGLILAAGLGTRLLPLTENKPKCLVDIAGHPLLEWQIRSLKSAGISNLSIVTGHHEKEILRIYPNTFQNVIYNKEYQTTNMLCSLMLGLQEFGTDTVISYSDIIYHPSIVSKLVNTAGDIVLNIDLDWQKQWEERFTDPLLDAESCRLDHDKKLILEIGKKASSFDQIEGQYMGLFKFNSKGLEITKKFYHHLMKRISTNKMSMTEFFSEMISAQIPVTASCVNGLWLEVDSLSDLSLYNRWISEKKIIPEILSGLVKV